MILVLAREKNRPFAQSCDYSFHLGPLGGVLVPTADCHIPCCIGYTRLLWPVWPFTVHYLRNCDRRRELAERILSGEDLHGGYVSQTVDHAALK